MACPHKLLSEKLRFYDFRWIDRAPVTDTLGGTALSVRHAFCPKACLERPRICPSRPLAFLFDLLTEDSVVTLPDL